MKSRKRSSRRARLFRRFRRRLFVGVGIVLLGTVLWQALTWPDVAALATHPPDSTAFLDHYRESRKAEPRWKWVGYEQISPELKIAVLCAEDIGFFDHQGFATEEIKAAIQDAVKEGKKLRGASTITQQLAKNLWLSPSRTPWRKVKETILTWQLERELSKRRILELYLNVVEFGPGVFGAEAGARHYFGGSAAGLSTSQAASLAASLPHSKWHPGADSPSYQRHRRRIEGRMQQARWLAKVI